MSPERELQGQPPWPLAFETVKVSTDNSKNRIGEAFCAKMFLISNVFFESFVSDNANSGFAAQRTWLCPAPNVLCFFLVAFGPVFAKLSDPNVLSDNCTARSVPI